MLLAAALSMLLAACGGSGGPAPATVQLSGKVTYDAVPAVAQQNAQGVWNGRLDYAQSVARPARGVQMEAVADDGSVLAATQAGADGAYALTVPANTSLRLRTKARLLQTPGNGASWDFAIRDNTSAGYVSNNAALYAVQGDAFSSGSVNQTQNLHAGSGWTGSAYGKPRAAAPFAILDQIYAAMQKVLAVNGQASFAPMISYWSVNNRPADGNPAQGNIGTSHWNPGGIYPGLYILGNENVDTDEYDSGVIVHEWGHYFESRFSRADSIGGGHGPGDLLDMRLAFGEGWGNSLAGMVRDDPLYIDTLGKQQSVAGVVFDLDVIANGEPRGWFNEASVQYVLYQLYKIPTIGFASIYNVMVGPQKTTEAFTSLFSFATYLRAQASAAGQSAIDQLLAQINTVGGPSLDIWGSQQPYPPSLTAGNQQFVLPIYAPLAIGTPATVCRTDVFGDDSNNKLGNIRYLRLHIAQSGVYKLNVISPAGSSGINVGVYLRGQAVPMQDAGPDTASLSLTAGDYVAAISHTSPNACMTATLSQ